MHFAGYLLQSFVAAKSVPRRRIRAASVVFPVADRTGLAVRAGIFVVVFRRTGLTVERPLRLHYVDGTKRRWKKTTESITPDDDIGDFYIFNVSFDSVL